MGNTESKRQQRDKLFQPLISGNAEESSVQVIKGNLNDDEKIENMGKLKVEMLEDLEEKRGKTKKMSNQFNEFCKKIENQPLKNLSDEDCIGLVISRFEEQNHVATGTLIGPNIVLTSGRALYNRERRKEATKIEFCFEEQNNSITFFNSLNVYYPKQFVTLKEDSYAYDYGILTLTHPVLERKFAPILEKKIPKFDNLIVAGYSEKEKVKFLTQISNKSYVSDKECLILESKSIPTQNGNPIFIFDQEGEIDIIGLVGNKLSNLQSSASILTDQKKKQISSWINSQLKGKRQNQKLGQEKTEVIELKGQTFSRFKNQIKGKETKIKKIELKQCQIEDFHLKTIGLFPNLIYLSLWDNNITANGVKAIAYGTLKKLLVLNLGFNDLTDESLVFIAKFEQLRELNLQENNITEKGLEIMLKSKTKIIDSLLILSLWGNNIEENGGKHLGEFNNLKQLYMCRNSLKNEGISYLGKGKLKSLQTLDLMFNEIGYHQIQSLTSLKNLKELYLFGNLIGSQGLRKLSQIKSAKKIHVLELGKNRINDEGIKFLKKFSLINKLYLSYNRISEVGLRKMIEVIPSLTNLTSISLRGNLFEKDEGKDFVLKSNKILSLAINI